MNPQNGGERFPTLPLNMSADDGVGLLQGPHGEGGEMEETGNAGEEDAADAMATTGILAGTGLPAAEAPQPDEALAAPILEGGPQ